MSDPFHLRPIRPADDPRVAALVRQVLTEFGAVGPGYAIMDAELEAMSAAYSESRSAYFVALRGELLVGCGGLAPLAEGDGATAELRKLYVAPEARGLGAGKALLTRCLAEAQRFGFARMYLESLRRMTAAGQLYRSFGFRPCERLGNTGHSSCEVTLALELSDVLAPHDD